MDLKDIAWNAANKIEGKDPAKWRLDACGALINYDCYDKQGFMFSWEIDHIFPKSVLEKAGVPNDMIDHPTNIRALSSKNNKTKSDNYPWHKKAYVREGNDNVEIIDDNIFSCIRVSKQKEIKELYKNYIKEFISGDQNTGTK